MEPEPRASNSKKINLEITLESANWSNLDFNVEKLSNTITETVIAHILPGLLRQVGISLLLTDDTHLASLNKKFLSKDGPTNVLSFPFLEGNKEEIVNTISNSEYTFLGDIAISYARIADESMQYEKSFLRHFAHMLAHGILHILGYDHIFNSDALIMEKLEKEILAKLNFKDIVKIS